MPRDRTTKKSLKSSFSDGLMVPCPAPCRKQYKLTASQRAPPELAFKQQNCQNKVYSFFFSNPGDIASIRPLFSASAPNVKKTLTWLQIRRVLSGKAEEFFFSCSAVLNITNSEKIKKKTKKNSQKTPGGTRGRGGGGGETQDSPARPALAVHVHLGRVL